MLRRIKEENPEIPVIIMTAQGSIEMAVHSMKMGAFDFLVKPFELDQIETLVQKGLERTRLKREVEWLRAQYHRYLAIWISLCGRGPTHGGRADRRLLSF